MNYVKTDPIGIDARIQPMQIDLYNSLSDSWGDVKGYGRVYKNDKQNRVVPEHYIGNGQYEEVLTDDNFVATFFFLESNEVQSQGSCLSRTRVDLVVTVDAAKARTDIDHYPDEEIRLQVLNIARRHFTSIDDTIKGKEALRGITTEGLDFIHPFFIFKITGIINNY